MDEALVRRTLDEEMAKIQETVGAARFEAGKFEEAASLLKDLVLAEEFTDFLTLPAYRRVAALA